jgi:hypothetical protein
MFKLLALPVLGYALWAMVEGRVVVKQGIGARTVVRTEEPLYFWTCCVIYAALAVALATIF